MLFDLRMEEGGPSVDQPPIQGQPTPSNPSFFEPSAPANSQEGAIPGENEPGNAPQPPGAEAVAPAPIPFPDAGITDEERGRFRELQASPEYKSIERNMAKCEERVVDKANRVLTNRGIQIRDPQDIERGVNIYLTDIWEKEPTTRLSALKRILNADENPRSRVWEKIIKEIKKLDGSSSD